MRFERRDVRDLIVHQKNGRGASYRRHRVFQRRSRPKFDFREIFGVSSDFRLLQHYLPKPHIGYPLLRRLATGPRSCHLALFLGSTCGSPERHTPGGYRQEGRRVFLFKDKEEGRVAWLAVSICYGLFFMAAQYCPANILRTHRCSQTTLGAMTQRLDDLFRITNPNVAQEGDWNLVQERTEVRET